MSIATQQAPAQESRKAAWSKGTKAILTNIITWQWTRQLVSWIIISAGTAADFGFLAGGLWMSLNAGLHQVFVSMLGANLDQSISNGVSMMYIGLPEVIVSLAVVTVIGHIRTYIQTREKTVVIWIVLFGLPTIVFLLLSFIVIYNSVIAADSNSTFILDKQWVGIRGISGFLFAFTSLIYVSIGKKQEADRLRERDEMIAALHQERSESLNYMCAEYAKKVGGLTADYDLIINQLRQDNLSYKQVIDGQKNELEARKAEKERFENEKKQDAEISLQAYSREFKDVLFSGQKSILITDICRFTGFNRNKVTNAIKNKNLETATRNKELVTVPSLLEWLPTVEPNTGKQESLLHIVNG